MCSKLNRNVRRRVTVQWRWKNNMVWIAATRATDCLTVCMAACVVLCLLSPSATALQQRRALTGTGYVPPVVAHLTPIGPMPATNRINLAIGLPLRNAGTYTTVLQQFYDPKSPKYRQFLTPAQFTQTYGATAQDYQSVITFAKANGLTVTTQHSNRILLDVSGTVANIQKAFGVNLLVYQHPTEGRTFFAPDTTPTVPLGLPVLDISGLTSYYMPRPMLRRTNHGKRIAQAVPNAGSGPGGTYLGNDFRTAYVPGVTLTGQGQTVGLLQFDGFYTNDILAYCALAGLSNVPLQVVSVNGGVPVPGANSSEVSLDIEMVISMAPGVASIIVYEAPNPSPWVDLLNRMATDNLAKQLSCSWGGGPPDAIAEQIFIQMALQGQSFFNASGDSDAFTGPIEFPADSPNITQVGGTTLTTGPGGAYVSETVWNDRTPNPNGGNWGSSGGISTVYPIPVWQQGINMTANGGSTTNRNIPDVALTADNIWVLFGNGQSGAFGGTSCAAPLWAGFMALVNQQAAASGLPPVGFVNPAVYLIGKGPNYTTDFHDITVGDNEWPGSPNNFVAVDGYDLCTGWGTPTPALITALAPSTGGGGACRPTTQPPQHDLCITRNARFWFTHGGTSYDNCATLLNAIAKNNTQFCLGFIALPANYENGDGVKDAVDALMEALSFYWKSKSYTGEAGGSQNQHLPACALCVARKKLAVELIAALANNTLLGTVPGNCTAADGTVIPTDLIPQAAAAAAGEDVVPIKYYTALLTKFNNSGLRDNFQGGLQECSPTPARFLAPVARDPTTQLNCPGINDDIPRAQAVFGFPFTTSVDLRLYHKDVPDPLCATTGTGADAVWKVLPPVAGAGRTFDVDTFGSNCDTVLWVLTPNGTMCSDNATPYSRQSQLTFTTDGINTYYIVAASKSGMTGKLKLNIHSY